MSDNFIFADKQSIQEEGLNSIFSQEQTDREESMNTDFPMMPLSTILKCTNNFSEEQKLGKGGFGPVYKVHNIYLFDFSPCNILT